MAKIIVYQKDNEIAVLQLVNGKEFSVGRSSDNDLCLNSENLSRQHFKIVFENNKWCVRLTARFGEIIYKNIPQKTFQLSSGETFAVTPYLFKFIDDQASDTTSSPVVHDSDDSTEAIISLDDKTFVADKTSATWSVGVPFIIITYPDRRSETLRLEGDYWLIGRDQKNEIFIEDPKASRNHAEISKVGGVFTIRDLNSSNGILFNERKLSKNVPTPLLSGDEFQIGSTKFYFEIRDPHFEDKLKNLPIENNLPNTNSPSAINFPTAGTAAVRINPQIPIYKKPLVIIIASVVLLVIAFTGGEEKKTRKKSGRSEQTSVAKELTPEQKDMVQRSHKLAKGFFMSQKYELALTEIQKVHEIVPSFEDSRDIENLCKEAIQIKMSQKEIEMREQQQQELQTRIRAITNECEDRFQSGTTSPDAIRECLSQALELDPENPDAQGLIARVEESQRQREVRMQSEAAYNNQVQSGKGLYSRALKFKEDGKTKEAIETFQRHIAMAYPDPENLKIKSKSELENLKQELKAKIVTYKREAEDFKSQDKLKEAILKLKKALELDPKNAEMMELQSEYTLDLRKNMKALYEDSVIEENVGNIEAAKEKWKKIKSQDIPNGEYLLKVRTKLKKYGLE